MSVWILKAQEKAFLYFRDDSIFWVIVQLVFVTQIS